MQQPTLQNVRIRSTRDACQIFYAVARNVLRMTTHRLDAEERRAIKSGNVYVWEERCANAEATGMGMERWTDGMGWGPSRVRDDFLFYHQRESGLNDDSAHPSARWASMMKGREPRAAGGKAAFARADAERLIKQTYSVHVALPEDRPRGVTRKWHLTAYFSQTTLDSMGTIDDIAGVGDVPAPDGWFRSARASKGKRTEAGSGDELVSAQDPWGLGFQPAPSHGMSQFPVEPGPAARAPPPAYAYGPRHAPAPAASAPHPPGRMPLPTMRDTGLRAYRDPSPLHFTSSTSASSSSDYDASPRLPFACPLTPPPPPAAGDARALVPLDVLQAAARIPRDPLDEQCLRRLSRADVPRALAGSARGRRACGGGGGGGGGDERAARVALQAEW